LTENFITWAKIIILVLIVRWFCYFIVQELLTGCVLAQYQVVSIAFEVAINARANYS